MEGKMPVAQVIVIITAIAHHAIGTTAFLYSKCQKKNSAVLHRCSGLQQCRLQILQRLEKQNVKLYVTIKNEAKNL